MGHRNTSFRIGLLSLFGCAGNILNNVHIVQWSKKERVQYVTFTYPPDPVTNICQEKVPRGLVRGDNVGGKVNTAAFTFSPGQHALTSIHMHNTMNTKDRKHNIKTHYSIAFF